MSDGTDRGSRSSRGSDDLGSEGVATDRVAPARLISEAAEIAAVHAHLLQPAFPVSELVTAEWLAGAVASGTASVLVSEDDSGATAVAVTERLGESASVLLSYFATRRDLRGRGVGSGLFAQMLDAVREQQSPSLVLAEVERPDAHSGSAEHGDPTARLRFYGRHGARALDLPYFQPPLGEGGEAVHGMLLLVLWADRTLVVSETGGPMVSGAGLVADAVEAILGAPSADESPESRALRAAAHIDSIRLYAVEDYQQISPSR